MSKQSVIEEMMRNTGGTIAEAEAKFRATFDAVKTVVTGGADVLVPGFGKFKMKKRAQRQARNPRTGEPITVAERNELTFKQSKA